MDIDAIRVEVQLVDGGADSHSAEETLDGVAHAASAHAEYNHRIFSRHRLYPGQSIRRKHSHVVHLVVGRERATSFGSVLHFVFLS